MFWSALEFVLLAAFSFSSTFVLFAKLRRKIYDEYNDEEDELTKEEIKIIRRLLKVKTPHAEVDPYVVCTLLYYIKFVILYLESCFQFICKLY